MEQNGNKLTNKQWLEIFPQGQKFLNKKLKNLKTQKIKLASVIKKEMERVKKFASQDDKSFLIQQIKVFYIWDLIKIEDQIKKLEIDLNQNVGYAERNKLWQEKVEYAKSVLIQDIALKKGVRLRKVGGALVGLCPLHKEKTPSFHIYTQTNSFKCYGCGKGGGTINFTMLLFKFSFKGAVEYLNY